MVVGKLYLLSLLNFFSFGLFVAVQTRYILSIGGTRVAHGILGSVHCFLQLFLGPIVGSLSDTKGRKNVLIVTTIGLIASDFLLQYKDLSAFTFSRIIFGSFNHIQLVLKALIADCVKDEKEQVAVFGKLGAIAGLAFIVGPITSGHIYNDNSGFHILVSIVTLLDLLSLAVIFSLKEPEKDNKKDAAAKRNTNPLNKLREVNWSEFWDVFLLKLLTEFGFALFFQTFGPILTDRFQASQKELGYIIGYFSMTMIVSNLVLGKINERFYSNDHDFHKRNLHGLIGLHASFGLLYIFPYFWMYIVIMLPLSLCKTILDRIWMEVVVKRVSGGDKGTVIGAFESLVPMSGLIAPVSSALISSYYGYDMVMICCMVPLSIAIGVVMLYKEQVVDNEKED